MNSLGQFQLSYKASCIEMPVTNAAAVGYSYRLATEVIADSNVDTGACYRNSYLILYVVMMV